MQKLDDKRGLNRIVQDEFGKLIQSFIAIIEIYFNDISLSELVLSALLF